MANASTGANALTYKGNDIDSDGDGTVNSADDATTVKGNDIDSDGDGKVDSADSADAVDYANVANHPASTIAISGADEAVDSFTTGVTTHEFFAPFNASFVGVQASADGDSTSNHMHFPSSTDSNRGKLEGGIITIDSYDSGISAFDIDVFDGSGNRLWSPGGFSADPDNGDFPLIFRMDSLKTNASRVRLRWDGGSSLNVTATLIGGVFGGAGHSHNLS